MPNVSGVFYSFDEFINNCENVPPAQNWAEDPNYLHSETGSKSFTESENFQSALDLAKFGWPAGAEKVNDFLVSESTLMGDKETVTLETSIQGFMPCVPAYVSNHPENMFRLDLEIVETPVLKIQFSCDVSGGTKTEKMMLWGAGICSLINSIEKTGTRCEIEIMNQTYSGDILSQVFINLKRPDQFLDIDRLSFAIAHPSFLRRLCFRWTEQQSELFENYKSGYGTPAHHNKSKIRGLDRTAFFVDFGHLAECYDFESTVEKLKKMYVDFVAGDGEKFDDKCYG